MKVCLIAPSLRILGGQAIQAALLLNGFKQEPLEMHLLPVNPPLRGVFGFCQKIKYLRTLVTEAAYLKDLLTEIPKYDVLHIFSASYFSFLLAPVPAMILGKLFKKKVILNYHSGEAEDHLQKGGWLVKRLVGLADQVVVPSRYLQSIFLKYGIESQAIGNVVPEENFPFQERSAFEPHFIAARNLEPMYNIACILRAFQIIQRKIPRASLTVLGYGKQGKYLKRLSAGMGLKNVRFTGRVERAHIQKFYEENDMMLNASLIDNMPVSILEAFSCGLPVISSCAGGIPEIVEDGKTGLLVPLDNAKALAESALSLIENQDAAKKIAQNAVEYCRSHHSWPVVRAKWIELYQGASS